MPTVEMILLTPSGRFRKRKGKIESDHPNHMQNNRDSQSYTMEEDPVFAVSPPMPLATWEELTQAPPVPVKRIPERFMAVSEDNNPFPLSTHPVLTREDMELRQRKRDDYYEEGVQAADSLEVKEALSNPFINIAFISLVGVICALCLIAGLLVANYKLNQTTAKAEVMRLI